MSSIHVVFNWSGSSQYAHAWLPHVHTTFHEPNLLSPTSREGSKRGVLDLQISPYPPFIFGVSAGIFKGECGIVV